MGRASVALGASDGSSGIMDGSIIRTHLFNRGADRSTSVDVDRVGQTLSRPKASESTPQRQHAPEAEEEVAREQLWFQLSLEERMQFGCFFSRMLLKCLSQTEQQEQEVRT